MKLGLSAPQLLQNNIYGTTADENLNNLVRHYYFFGEYKIDASDKLQIIPSTLVKYVQGAPFQFDFNTRALYIEKYWLGVSYRYNNSVAALIGLNYKSFSFGYSYDYALTDIKDYSSGGHEIFLSMRLFEKKVPTTNAKFD